MQGMLGALRQGPAAPDYRAKVPYALQAVTPACWHRLSLRTLVQVPQQRSPGKGCQNRPSREGLAMRVLSGAARGASEEGWLDYPYTAGPQRKGVPLRPPRKRVPLGYPAAGKEGGAEHGCANRNSQVDAKESECFKPVVALLQIADLPSAPAVRPDLRARNLSGRAFLLHLGDHVVHDDVDRASLATIEAKYEDGDTIPDDETVDFDVYRRQSMMLTRARTGTIKATRIFRASSCLAPRSSSASLLCLTRQTGQGS
ncbi:uncharacterized protein SCHCODRAFT_01351573 [Schizophyllum commune H4-8]|nr:uncharacterized protein SCHCODRAFT_01351573 [Schizophyllum commune H4-8]KAI5897079.1 hypothetical protein SCHCODRAFT_01351573 [Schizophyllum commune H4-8]